MSPLHTGHADAHVLRIAELLENRRHDTYEQTGRNDAFFGTENQ